MIRAILYGLFFPIFSRNISSSESSSSSGTVLSTISCTSGFGVSTSEDVSSDCSLPETSSFFSESPLSSVTGVFFSGFIDISISISPSFPDPSLLSRSSTPSGSTSFPPTLELRDTPLSVFIFILSVFSSTRLTW